MWLLYDACIYLLLFLARAFSFFIPSLQTFFSSRKQASTHISITDDKPVICFHCASLGEYQMMLPLLGDGQLRSKYFVVITFFSPSGFNHANILDVADAKYFLPFDTKRDVRRFLDQISPQIFVFVKYDFWFRLMHELDRKRVKTVLINGLFRKEQFLMRPIGTLFLETLKSFDRYFVQDQNSAHLLLQKGFDSNKVLVTNDLRYDRVFDICDGISPNARIERFKSGHKLLILGSSWPVEEKLLELTIQSLGPDYKILIAPHDVSEKHIDEIENQFVGKKINLWTENEDAQANILILNTIGRLSEAYQYANIAFIGGGWGKGLHNILEAATFGMPIICGPKISKYPEASIFKSEGVLFDVADDVMFKNVLTDLMNDETRLAEISQKARYRVQQSTGARKVILPYLLT